MSRGAGGSALIDSLLGDTALVSRTALVVTRPDGSLGAWLGTLSASGRSSGEDAAWAFLRAHADLVGLPASDAPAQPRVVANRRGGGATHIVFMLYVVDTPVLGSEVGVHLDDAGVVRLLNGSFPRVTAISRGSAVSADEAMRIAASSLRISRVRRPMTAARAWLADGRGARCAWRVTVAADDPMGDWDVLVDAGTGEIVRTVNNLNFVTGRGSVYAHHPAAGTPVEVPLPYLVGQWRHDLCGDFAQVNNMQGDEASNPADIHVYAPTDTHFAEVMGYHHITRAHDFFKSIGCATMETSMRINVHHRMKDNAFFSPRDASINLGDGEKMNDFWAEESVFYHEYAHAVYHSIHPTLNWKESGAMNEGQADYFAASLDNDPIIGEYVMARAGQPWLRNLTDTVHYPEDIDGQVHQDGRIWGATLWDLRTALGATVTDRLVLAGFQYIVGEDPTFIDGLTALLAADQALYQGANLATIQTVFARRGITGDSAGQTVLDAADLAQMARFRRVHGE